MANDIVIGGLQLEFTDKGSKEVAQDLTALAEALEAVKSASKGGSLTSKTKQLNALISSVENIKTEAVDRLNNLAQSLVAIGAVSPSTNLAKLFDKLGSSIDGVDTSKIEDIKNSVSGSAFSDTETPAVDYSEIKEEISSFADGITEKMAQGRESAEAFADSVNDVKAATSGLEAKPVKDLSDTFTETKNKASATSEQVIMAKESVSAFNREEQATGHTSGIEKVKGAFLALIAPIENGAQRVLAFEKRIKSIASSAISSGIGQLATKFKNLGSALFGAHSFAGKLLKSFVRIAFYRSIRFSLSSMVKGFKEGATNLYAWSDAFDKARTFANSMDKIATSILYVKNSLGAMIAPIVNALAPALDFLADKFVGVLNIINEFISALTGASTYTVARKIGTQFQEIADGAGAASKAIHSFTIGIDELNIIEDTGRDGGGYGGLGNVAEDWFEKKAVSSDMQNFADTVRRVAEDVHGYFEWLFSDDAPRDMQATLEDLGSYLPTWEEGWEYWAGRASEAWDGITWALNGYYNDLKKYTKWVKDNDPFHLTGAHFLSDFFEDPLETLKEFNDGIWDLRMEISKIEVWVFKKIGEALLEIYDIATWLPRQFKKIFEKVLPIDDAFASILRNAKKLIAAAKDLAKGDVQGAWETIMSSDADKVVHKKNDAVDGFVNFIAAGIIGSTGSLAFTIGAALDRAQKQADPVVKQAGNRAGNTLATSIQTGINGKDGVLRQTTQNLAYNAISQFSSAHNIEQFKIGGQNLVAGIIQGLDSKKGQLYTSIQKVVDETYQALNKRGQMHSPSRLFAVGGKNFVLGLNKGVEDNMETTKKVIEDWYSVFEDVKPNVDMSAITLPDVGAIATSVSGSINASTNVTTQAMTGELAEFFTETLMPVISEISADTKRQADKDENVVLDGRKLTDSVNKRNRTSGYSFT